MTNKQLIDFLKKFPEESEVYIDIDGNDPAGIGAIDVKYFASDNCLIPELVIRHE